MRCFLAIELPDPVREHLTRAQEKLSGKIGKASFTRAESLHITLKFLGEVRDQEIAKLTDSLAGVKSGGAIELSAQRVDCFPNRGPVRIVAAIFGGSDRALPGVHAAIEQRCQYLGFDKEKRKYTPHATIARARPILPAPTRQLVQQETSDMFPGPTFLVRDFVLMQSRLQAGGSVYVPLTRFNL